jgi:DNA-directed RNA polymerase beta' subunit
VRALSDLSLHVLRWPSDARLDRITIQPASPEQIRRRAPSPVVRPDTLDFRTLVPERGGLFDYKVFGPGTVIDAPIPRDDEPWKPRNTKFARLVLAQPIVHPLFVLHVPDDVAERADLSRAELDASVRGDDPAAYANVVARLEASVHGPPLILRELPVLPPDLRPLTRLADDRWQSSSLNDLYRRVIDRNNRWQKLVELAAPANLAGAERRNLCAALLALFDNELQDDPLRDPQQKPMISLRGLCGGNGGCIAALRELDARSPTDTSPLPTRLHKIDSVMFALGFELRRAA